MKTDAFHRNRSISILSKVDPVGACQCFHMVSKHAQDDLSPASV